MIKKLLMCLALLAIPFITYGAGIQFYIANDSSGSIPNPIHITGGYIQYHFEVDEDEGQKLSPECQGTKTINLGDSSSGMTIPFPIAQGTPSTFTFNAPNDVVNCINEGTPTNPVWADIALYITTVDNISKQDGQCKVGTALNINQDTATIKFAIQEFTNDFWYSTSWSSTARN